MLVIYSLSDLFFILLILAVVIFFLYLNSFEANKKVGKKYSYD